MDFKSAVTANLAGRTDLEVLALAAQEHRILVTQDVRTMPRYFADFLRQQTHSPGVILIPQSVSTGAAIDALVLVWAATEPEEWADRIVKIPF